MFDRRRHGGNHVYVFPLTRASPIAVRSKPGLAYPVLDRTVTQGDGIMLPLLVGAHEAAATP